MPSFPDADTDNFMADKTDTAIAICNDTSTPRSLMAYIGIAHFLCKAHVTSYFPQLSDGVIQPYVLQNSKAEYTNYEQYAIEMVQNIRIPDSIPLDGNQDGMTRQHHTGDRRTGRVYGRPALGKSLPGGRTVSWRYPCRQYQPDEQLHAAQFIFSGVGTLCHEFLHSIGYPDLYRKDSSSGNPVGQWDLMATNSIFLQYPLAYQRYAVSGWLDAKTITTAGTYTYSQHLFNTGDRLYLLKTPFSDTEFFAVECRIPGKQYSEGNWTEILRREHGSLSCQRALPYRATIEVILTGIYVFPTR